MVLVTPNLRRKMSFVAYSTDENPNAQILFDRGGDNLTKQIHTKDKTNRL